MPQSGERATHSLTELRLILFLASFHVTKSSPLFDGFGALAVRLGGSGGITALSEKTSLPTGGVADMVDAGGDEVAVFLCAPHRAFLADGTLSDVAEEALGVADTDDHLVEDGVGFLRGLPRPLLECCTRFSEDSDESWGRRD